MDGSLFFQCLHWSEWPAPMPSDTKHKNVISPPTLCVDLNALLYTNTLVQTV